MTGGRSMTINRTISSVRPVAWIGWLVLAAALYLGRDLYWPYLTIRSLVAWALVVFLSWLISYQLMKIRGKAQDEAEAEECLRRFLDFDLDRLRAPEIRAAASEKVWHRIRQIGELLDQITMQAHSQEPSLRLYADFVAGRPVLVSYKALMEDTRQAEATLRALADLHRELNRQRALLSFGAELYRLDDAKSSEGGRTHN